MKVIILGDTHMGARSGDLDFVNYFNKFYSEFLYPYMKEHNIKNVVQLGDYFDNQTNLGLVAWEASKPVWVEEFRKNGFFMHVLVGNHDIPYRNTLRVNSPELILSEYTDSFKVISEPTTITFDDGYSFDVVPWICKENEESVLAFIKKQQSPVLLGHFAIEGFPMYKGGTVDRHGLSMKIFDQYPFVFSGHYHTRSSSGNIEYTGVPYEMTWSDYGDPKGFVVFDTENQTTEFVENPYTMFEKIQYSEDLDTKTLDITGKIVKVIVVDRGDIKKYNKFLAWAKDQPTKELIIDECVSDTSAVSEVDLTEVDWASDTEEYIKKVVDVTETDLSKDDVVAYLSELHQRASAI